MAILLTSDPDFLENAYPAIHEHRPTGIIPNIDHGATWLLESDEIRRVSRQESLASDPENADPNAPVAGISEAARLSVFYSDRPDPTRTRGLVTKEFAAHRVRQRITQIPAVSNSIETSESILPLALAHIGVSASTSTVPRRPLC